MTIKEQRFIEIVLSHYREHGRHDLPWRKNQTPYRVLVSELMLQQTQVDRVIPKYQNFLEKFPDVNVLADARLGAVLTQWQGLGYNRRAKFLHQTAQKVTHDLESTFPATYNGLLVLPGIGPYTAAAVMIFAYNKPVSLIETNIRQVYLHHFFTNKSDVTDADILPIVSRTMSQDNPREWCATLMDYGTHLKKIHGNINKKSKHYTKQSTFQGSDRQIRGAILVCMTSIHKPLTSVALKDILSDYESKRVLAQLQKLVAEDFLLKEGSLYALR